MLLTENFLNRIPDYDAFTSFHISTEQTTNTCSRISLKSHGIEILIDIEEQASYASFFIRSKRNGHITNYYTLSDYSCYDGVRQTLFETEKEEKEFVSSVIQATKNRRKLFSKDKDGDQIVACILSFISNFVLKLL